MRLEEFEAPQAPKGIKVADFISRLRSQHQLAQLGGIKRVYQIGNTGKIGVIYFLDNSEKGVGVAWDRGNKVVSTVYVWSHLNTDNLPDVAVDIPVDASIDQLITKLGEVIATPKIGIIEAEDESGMRLRSIKPKAGFEVDGDDVVPIQSTDVKKKGTIKIGEPPKGNKQEIDDITHRLIQKGQVVLMARKASGEYFFVPNMEQHLRKLDAMLDKQIETSGGGKTMEQQYEELESEVGMVASGKTRFVKSVIIIGAPSSGKSFRVMKVLKELGLQAGRDYIFKTGSVTPSSLYRLMIEQIDGMIVFDDCDSVWETTSASNYMKGALNTGDIRTINNDTAKTTGIAVLDEGERRKWLKSASRILRNKPLTGDLERVYPKARTMPDHSEATYSAMLAEAQAFLRRSPPDQIDFAGRIIFISNLERSQLDSAVVSRANVVEMSFGDDEMLDFMERIGDKIEGGVSAGTPLPQSEIDEVFAFVRFQTQADGFKSPLNFRFIQKCFDYRRSNPNWKNMIKAM